MVLIDMQVDIEPPEETDNDRAHIDEAVREIVQEARADEALPIHEERKGVDHGPQQRDERHPVIDSVIRMYAFSVSMAAIQQKRHHDDSGAIRHKNLFKNHSFVLLNLYISFSKSTLLLLKYKISTPLMQFECRNLREKTGSYSANVSAGASITARCALFIRQKTGNA